MKIKILYVFFLIPFSILCQKGKNEIDYTKYLKSLEFINKQNMNSQELAFIGCVDLIFKGTNQFIYDTTLTNQIASKKLNQTTYFELLEEIRKSNITIINEAHDRIKPRLFIYDILDEIKDMGYTHLAFETVYNNQSNLNSRTGYYTKEPVFGELYRKAIKLGFKVIGYESFEEPRDSLQAENIAHQIVNQQGTVKKTLIICGYGHLYEKYYDPQNKMMGAYLKEKTGIDPLTIDLTMIQEAEENQMKQSVYQVYKNDTSNIIFSRKELRCLELFPDFCDYYVLLSPTKILKRRSSDYSLNGEKSNLTYSCQDSNTVLVQLYLKKETYLFSNINELIPTDISIVLNNQAELFIRKNVNYLIIERDKNNKILVKKKYKFG